MSKRVIILLTVLTAMTLMIGCSKDNNPILTENQTPALKIAASAIPADAVIDSAKFYIYVAQADTQSVTVHEVNADWTEGEVTFNSFAAGFDTAAVATLTLEGAGWVAVDVSTQVKGWFDSTIENYGFFFQALEADSNAISFNSREADENQPYLEVYLTTHEGESMETLDAVADAYNYSADPDANFGSAADLIVRRDAGADSVYQSLVRFEFPVEIRYISIGDRVWLDDNRDGVQDEGENGLEGVTVNLYDCDGNMIASTMTDENGMYVFDELDAGSYMLKVVNPFGYILTYQDMGDDDSIDSDFNRYQKNTVCFTLDWGDEMMDMDAGMFAFDGCTYGKGYWKNHGGLGPQNDEVTKLLTIWLGDEGGDKSMEVTDVQMTYDVLQQHEYDHPSNGITKLYAHLLTAKLNIVNFANPEDIYETILDADSFLADHNWMDWDGLDSDSQKMVLHWKGMLEEYNEGMTGPGSCDEDDSDDMDGGY